MILLQAYHTSSIANQIIAWMILVCAIIAGGIIPAKMSQLKIILSKSHIFLAAYRKRPHPAALHIESDGRLHPGIPLISVYKTGVKQFLGILHKRGFSNDDILNMQPDPGTVSGTLSEAEMRSIEAAVNSELAEQTIVLERHMSALGTITNCATSLGLFGTVFGVMEAFMSMSSGGSSMISKVAPGISGAMLTTVMGLFVSIIGTIFYNHLADKLKEATAKTETFADEFLADLSRKHS